MNACMHACYIYIYIYIYIPEVLHHRQRQPGLPDDERLRRRREAARAAADSDAAAAAIESSSRPGSSTSATVASLSLAASGDEQAPKRLRRRGKSQPPIEGSNLTLSSAGGAGSERAQDEPCSHLSGEPTLHRARPGSKNNKKAPPIGGWQHSKRFLEEVHHEARQQHARCSRARSMRRISRALLLR